MDTQSCVQEITSVTEVCDEHLTGWAYWQFKNFGDLTTTAGTSSEGFYNKDGRLQQGKVKALSRTYLQMTQGDLVSMKFNSTNSNFDAKFTVDTSIQQPSVLYWSKAYYPLGFNFNIIDAQGNSLSMESGDYNLDLSTVNYAKFTVLKPSLNGQTLTLSINAKYI